MIYFVSPPNEFSGRYSYTKVNDNKGCRPGLEITRIQWLRKLNNRSS